MRLVYKPGVHMVIAEWRALGSVVRHSIWTSHVKGYVYEQW